MSTINALISIGDYDFPEPSKYEGNTSTLVNSSRNTKGVMIGSVIRDDIAKVTVSWNYLTVEDWANINKKFKTSAGGKFINDVTFLDQTTGEYITRQMYVSDRKAGMWRRDENGNVLGWINCSLSLVEV